MAVYSSNVLLVMGLISTLALGAFGEKPSDEMLGTRSGIVLTLQLTTIAFKFVIADSLPKVSYDTTLDMYMNMCSIFLGIVFFENAIVARFGEMGISEDLRDILDGYFALTIASLWFAANAIFVYVIRKYICKRSWDRAPW
ncbi:nicotinic acetylcholine receptor alpha 9b subunit [Chrysochromulina tobinii]|uniref:Nicotinic acetylcholine receptor alpha 9b subunit n=1 Tax=Chrysochromulina tobinii TaxID=1460289 RepID=A0A0M0JV08_9EUKA|nr:nicotinic acetylcholine receptor alpha 9b subunit [Chrysochromulina tobinii]|eukprot:KOO30187.1 nicotinic acetylcholine receptor alpha 9b subunit [Chrysochromulina sp. CCMP291]